MTAILGYSLLVIVVSARCFVGKSVYMENSELHEENEAKKVWTADICKLKPGLDSDSSEIWLSEITLKKTHEGRIGQGVWKKIKKIFFRMILC